MLQRLYDKTLALAAHRHATRYLAGISFIESSVFPIPPDVMLAPMVIAKRKRAFRYALICTIASVLGALLGYAIGAVFWETLGQPIINFYGYEAEFARFQEGFVEYGVWLVFIFGITFFPFKVITIASGVAALDPIIFIVSAIIARGFRFLLVAGLLWKFGPPIQAFVEKRLGLMVSIGMIVLIAGFVLIKWI